MISTQDVKDAKEIFDEITSICFDIVTQTTERTYKLESTTFNRLSAEAAGYLVGKLIEVGYKVLQSDYNKSKSTLTISLEWR